jgi:hypothetical protein
LKRSGAEAIGEQTQPDATAPSGHAAHGSVWLAQHA